MNTKAKLEKLTRAFKGLYNDARQRLDGLEKFGHLAPSEKTLETIYSRYFEQLQFDLDVLSKFLKNN